MLSVEYDSDVSHNILMEGKKSCINDIRVPKIC